MNRKTVWAAAAVLASVLPAFAQVKDWKDIRYPALPEFKIPKPETFTLKNGLRVYLLPDHELPLVTMTARIRAGADLEPADKTGLASILGTVQRSGGTATMPGDEMDEYLAARAASVETGVGDDSAFASMNCLAQDFDDVFKVWVDVVRNPAFPQDKIEVAKVQQNTGIARRNDDVNGIAGRELAKLVYGADSPIARTTEYATIGAVTRDDLVAFHAKYWHPNDVLLGVTGDFDPKAMRKKIEAALGSWPKGPDNPVPHPEYRKTPRPGNFFVEKSDVTQASVGMAHLGIEIGNPDYFAVQVMNEVLGGGFASRMFSNIRSKKALAYSVGGGLRAGFTAPGMFQASMQTKSQSVFEAVEAMKDEIRGIISNPPSDDEMKRAKESILNSFVFNYDSTDKILGQQLTYAYYGLPANFLETYRTNIEKVTKDDVARVAKKYVHPDDLTVLVVGKAADFGKPVTTLGKVETLDISIPPPPDTGPKAVKNAASAAEGRKVLDRAVKALGGSKPGDVVAIRTSGNLTVHMQGQTMALGQTILIRFPDSVRQTVRSPMGEQVVVMTPDQAFMSAGPMVRDLPAEAAEKERAKLGRDLKVIVRYHDDPSLEALAAGKDDVDGTHCDLVQVSFRGAKSVLCVAADGRVLRQTFQGTNPMTRADGNAVVTFSDYRELDGRMVPHKEVIQFDGQEFGTLELEKFEVNPEIEASAFEKPAAS